MPDFTDVDFDLALADKDATKRRLAAGERLRLVRNGLPFAIVTEPEHLDLFTREVNPSPPAAETRAPPVAPPPRERRRPQNAKELRELIEEDWRRFEAIKPTMTTQEILDEPVPEWAKDLFNEEGIAFLRSLRGK